MFEERVKFFQGAGDAFLGGGFVGAEGLAEGAEVEPFIKAKDNGGAVRRGGPRRLMASSRMGAIWARRTCEWSVREFMATACLSQD